MTFKAHLITSITFAVALVLAVFITIAYVSLNISENRFSEEAIRGKSVLWQKVIKVQLDQMTASTSSLTRARDTLKALRKSNINELAESLSSTYNRLSSSNILSRLQVADLSGAIVFSKPNTFSGQTSKTLVKKAISEKKIFQGIELDDDGKIIAEIAFPLYYRGKLAGVGIYMTELDAAITNFKLADGSEVHLFSGDALENSTDSAQFKNIQLQSKQTESALQFKQDIDEQIYSLVQLPIQDVSGNPIANLLTATDYTESYTHQSNIYVGGILSVLIAFLVCMLFIYWFIGRAFKPMYTCLNIMGRISSGNLTDEIRISSKNEFGQLMQGLKEMQDKLKGMISDINTATFQIENSANNLQKVTHDSSDRVSDQIAITQKIEETIDTLMQASDDVNSSTSDSMSATEQASTEIINGRNVIIESVDTISSISEHVKSAESVVQEVQHSSETIGSVLDVIKGIAEQTNLLALNAAIEAARAGEQGRGFAVVADEVRTLASRTSESTNEIESMIEGLQKSARNAVTMMGSSIEMVNKGVDISNKADDSFNAIAQTVESINEKCRSISLAADNQMALSQTMHSNVKTISNAADEAVLGNKSTVESSEELIQLADTLKQKVEQFQT